MSHVIVIHAIAFYPYFRDLQRIRGTKHTTSVLTDTCFREKCEKLKRKDKSKLKWKDNPHKITGQKF